MSTFASQFAPYSSTVQASNSRITRPWFPVHGSSSHTIPSYQSGGIPTFGDSQRGGAAVLEETENQRNVWETRFGMRVDLLAAFAYLLGPISAFLLLVLETHNDYVRFHAYQSALLTAPLLILRIFLSIVPFPSFLRTLFTFVLVVSASYMAVRAYIDAARNGLSRFELPLIGAMADQWVKDE
ncbi:hypothetical protein PUNSTDRAFT_109915 [Punctularia strigosozonata HHB-11173 SS5]|uniref:uncharacterized protein n=1 Tax=Punctularia strigosozonata (strain HHB-11173) TaxID=741275 RepID=UPI000441792F|nr:uncharacterized protein PUNSTDRAFT_109915 [Punctularia strigosozonata HHB-11173 SS5]EIN13733.1 hypothetical protein PUNSTDRAFT_109915 [Punctularia strigosozonata HHB-11173 SS5]